jgi:hypothetical protein
MAIEFVADTATFLGETTPTSQTRDVVFSAPVISASVALRGWELEFDTAAPVAHRVDEMRANVVIVPPVPVAGQPDTVRWQADVNLEDASGGDAYNASVKALIIAET